MPQIIKNLDDLAWADGEREVDADAGEHTLSLDGDRVTLLLSTESLDQLRRDMHPYMEAGRLNGDLADTPKPKRDYGVRPPGTPGKRGTRRSDDPSVAEYREHLREWVDEIDFRHPKYPDYPAYKTPHSYRYPDWLCDPFDKAHPEYAHLRYGTRGLTANGMGGNRARGSERVRASPGDRVRAI